MYLVSNKKLKSVLWLFVITICLVFTSCDEFERQMPLETDNPGNYRCTSSQLMLVEKEFEICGKSGYFSSACFLFAKKSQCEYIGPEVK